MAAMHLDEQAIFEVARKIESRAEREGYLQQICGDDTVIGQRVRALLKAYGESASFLESPAAPLGATMDDPVSERPGAVIGPYKLLEQVGEGGFGVVFMAEQQHPVRRKVALKVLKAGMDTKQVIARFEAERQALALMDHPNIAQVFDGGATESGRPFFVMELVKGVPITEYCDQSQLTPNERLELFIHVCQAVQHAHQKGIIHRDLKPSNVLVTLYDGAPVVKVIDFGIAKSLGQQLTEKTMYTGFAQMIGTPLYMSPEQAGQSSLDVDTRSDIYSLGVLLYELLTGTTPFDKERLKEASYDEIRRIIREEEPPRPSTRMSTLGQAAATLSAQRQSDPRRLSQLLRGELDWIVMKALEKDRNRRYETANAFAADVQRYLHDEPVLACPPTAWYRFRKFGRRNKAGLATAGLILLVIVLLGGGAGWLLGDRAAQRALTQHDVEPLLDAATEVLQHPEKNPREAQHFLDQANARMAGGGPDELRDRLSARQRDVATAQRLDQAWQRAASVADGKRDYRGADRLYTEAFAELGLEFSGGNSPEQADALRASPISQRLIMGLDHWAFCKDQLEKNGGTGLRALADQADDDDWRRRLRAALGPHNDQLLTQLAQLAKEETSLQRAPADLALLGIGLRWAGNPAAAETWYRLAVERHPQDFWINVELAGTLLGKDPPNAAEALPFIQAARALRPENPEVLANRGEAWQYMKEYDRAIRDYDEAIQLDPKYAQAFSNRGAAWHKKKEYDRAMRDFDEAIRLDPKDAKAFNNRGNAWLYKKEYDRAILDYDEAIQLDPKSALAFTNRGAAWSDKKEYDRAIRDYDEAIQLDPKSALAFYNRGNAWNDKKEYDRAIRDYDEAIRLYPKNATAHCNRGHALGRQGKFTEALEALREGHELGSKQPGWRYPSAQWVRHAERLVELERKLLAILEGKDKLADDAERIALARMCQQYKNRYAASARFYAEAFEGTPELAKDPRNGLRYNAACAAALACCGKGEDAAALDDKDGPRLRKQALTWLQADLALWTKLADSDEPKGREAAQEMLQHWQTDSDLAGLRDKEAIDKLPEGERATCQTLWADVDALLARVKAKAKEAPPDKP
jgi:serine/threonine protein kinase/Tfp pilus assembly protein PilF